MGLKKYSGKVLKTTTQTDYIRSGTSKLDFTFPNKVIAAKAVHTGGYGSFGVFHDGTTSYQSGGQSGSPSGTYGYINNLSISSDQKTLTVSGANNGNDNYAKFTIFVMTEG